MNSRRARSLAAIVTAVLLACGLGLSGPAAAAANPVASFIAVFAPGVASAAETAGRLERQHGVQGFVTYEHALKGFAFRGTRAAAAAIAQNPQVAYVEPDGVLYALGQTLPSGIDRVDADSNAVALINGADERVDVDVAVIDTGVDYDHPDLYVVKRIDCTNESGGPPWSRTVSCVEDSGDDGNGHGTHVAGTIAALDNGDGVVGVAPGARIWAIKVLSDSGSGSFAMVIAGVDQVAAYAADIEVANMSLGGQGESQALQDALANAVSKGVVFAVAAGNDGADVYGDGDYSTKGDNYIPASYPEVMTVSALADTDGAPGGLGSSTSYGADDTLASFSNYATTVAGSNPVTSPGKAIDVAAPGVSIYSTYKDGTYATASGTSMASPHAAGAAALYVAAHGRATGSAGVASIRQALIDGGQPQTEWRSDGATNDPDGNQEPMAYVGDGTASEPVNDAPVAADDTASTTVDTAVTIDVLANDSDPEGDTLTVTNLTQPANGTATVNADNSVTYVPNTGFTGTDSFSYTAFDGELTSNVATVSVAVQEASAGWTSGDLEGSVWSDSGNPNGKTSNKDYSFTPALGQGATLIEVTVNVSLWNGGSGTLTASLRHKGANYLICSGPVSGPGMYTLSTNGCAATTAASVYADGQSNTLRLEVGPLYKGDGFEVDFVQVHVE